MRNWTEWYKKAKVANPNQQADFKVMQGARVPPSWLQDNDPNIPVGAP